MQILFASLLTVVFTERFTTISSLQRGTYVVTLLAAACAAALLVGPVAFHRIVFRHSQKDDLVRVSHRMALGGLACLPVALVGGRAVHPRGGARARPRRSGTAPGSPPSSCCSGW